MQYSPKFKEKIIAKASASDVSVNEVARNAGIPPSTLFTWLSKAKMLGMSGTKKSRGRPSHFSRKSAEEKLRIFTEFSALGEDEIGAFLRKEGLHMSDINTLRNSLLASLVPPKKGPSPEKLEIRQLNKELRRKEKALAEAAALLVLKKKFLDIMEDEEENTPHRFGEDD